MATPEERKKLKAEYKMQRRAAGVFAVTNIVEGRVFLGSCLDAERPLRRILFELQFGSFKNRALQSDFSRLGEEAFTFAVLETVPLSAERPEDELELLEEKYLAELDLETAYNTDARVRFR